MKKIYLIISIFYIIVWNFLSPIYAITQEEWLEVLSYGERDEGNVAEQALTQWLLDYAQNLGIDAIRYDLSAISGNMHSFGSNVGYYFAGEQEAELVFVAPQSDYDASVLLLLALAKYLSQIDLLPYSVRILFLSGEHSPHWLVASAAERQAIYPIGTQQLLRIGLINNYSYTFYHRIKEPTKHLSVGREQYLRSPHSLVALMAGLSEYAGWQIDLPRTNVVPRKINRKHSYPIDEYLSREFAAISIFGEPDGHQYTLEETIKWANDEAQNMWDYLSTHATVIESDQEFNYLIIGRKIIQERTFLSWVLLWILVFLIFLTLRRHKLRSQWIQLRRKGKSIWLLLPLSFIALFLSTFITYAMNIKRGDGSFWQYMPIAFASYKVIWTLFLSAMLGRLFEGLQLGGRERFYDISTIILAGIALFIFSIINVLYVVAWVWFLVIYALYDMIKQWHIRFVLVLLAPIGILFFASDFFFQSSPEIAQFILFDSILGNLILLLVFSPILMLIMSLFQHRKILRANQVPAYFSFIVYVGLLGFLYLFLTYVQPYDKQREEPVWLLVTEEGTSRRRQSLARIWSMQKLGSIALTNLANGKIVSLVDIPTVMVDAIPMEPIGKDFTLNVDFEEVLNRTRTVISLTNLMDVEYLDLQIRSDRTLGVVDANVPIIVDDQQNLRILMGKNPPPTLMIQLISNDPIRIQVKATASYKITQSMRLDRNNSYLDAAYAHIIRERSRMVLEI